MKLSILGLVNPIKSAIYKIGGIFEGKDTLKLEKAENQPISFFGKLGKVGQNKPLYL